MSSNQQPDDILNSSEIIRLTSEKPVGLIPLWEFVLALLVAIAISLLFYFGYFGKLENASIDFRFKQRGELPHNQDIVLVGITEECLNQLGSWPWSRATHGKLLSILKADGAKVAAFDIMFNDAPLLGNADDEEFATAIRNFGRVVLPQVITRDRVLDNETFEMVEKDVVERPTEILRAARPGEGFIDLDHKVLNPDGVIRKLLLHKQVAGVTNHMFGLAAAAAYLSVVPVVENAGIRLGDRLLPYFDCYEPESGQRVKSYLVNYAGGYRHFDEISYADAISGKFRTGFFRNRLVLIGTRAMGTSEDLKFCPYGALAGVEIHANLLHNILNRSFLHRTSIETTILLIFVFAFGIAYVLWKTPGMSANLLCLGSAVLWLTVGIIIFKYEIILEITPIVLMVPIQWSITRLIQQFETLREKNYDLARKVRELAIINEVSKAVSFMGDLGRTLDAILSRGVQVLNAQRGSLFLLDDKYEELVEKSVIFGVEGDAQIDQALKQQFKSGIGIAGEVFNSGKPRLIQNVKKDKSFAFRDSERDSIRTMICVPLMIKDSAIGVMNVVNRREGRFNEEDLQTALTMANQAAVVIEKARLYNLATIDGLTGLVVRRHFQAKIEEEYRRARRYNKPLTYLMTDIDHFKKFNDTYGHQTGDMVLREVARIVRGSVRDTDIAARYGGEEFAVILPETEPEGAMLFAERLRQSVEAAVFEGPTGGLQVTISVGVCSMPVNQPESATEMIKMADDALYVCKRNGRNRVERAENAPPAEAKPEKA
ncbi:MAG TPA: diguanylate cyclase [Candidatus Rifleibacterium sp.]|nr:diguanylate cyclase [Candidatus Rifleibacterium sp.]